MKKERSSVLEWVLLSFPVLFAQGCEQKSPEIKVIVSNPPPKQYRVLHVASSGLQDAQKKPVPLKELLDADALEIHLPAEMKPRSFLETVPVECVGMRGRSFSLRLVVPGQKPIEVDIATEHEGNPAIAGETGRHLPLRDLALVNFDENQVMTVQIALNDVHSPMGTHRTASLGISKGLSFKILADAVDRLKTTGFDRFCFRMPP